MDGKYALSKSLNAPYKGRPFSKLSDDEQDAIRQFSFISEVMHGVSDADVLQIFARLNTYSVKLNAQELRNGRFLAISNKLRTLWGMSTLSSGESTKSFLKEALLECLRSSL